MLWGKNRRKGQQPRQLDDHQSPQTSVLLYFHLITSNFIYFQREARCFEYAYAYLRLQTLCSTSLRGMFVNTDETNAVCTMRYTVFTVIWCHQSFALRVSSHCKQDVGTLSWLHVETLKRVSIPPLCQSCKVPRSWVLFCETPVYNM